MILPRDVGSVLSLLNKRGFESYVVGGCIRDTILGRIPKDWDVCTSATPEEIKACFDGFKTIDTGIKHGTVTLILPIGDGHPIEVTTFRTDGEYSDGRHPDSVEFSREITVDLSRRDFTMNAIAYAPNSGFIDPFGGMEDIKEGVIRCVGDPEERFQEDALRVLRALRFASVYGFEIDASTCIAIHLCATLLRRISAERIRDELCKMLKGESVERVMKEYSDVMAVIIPELKPCIGFKHNNRFHKFNVYDHIANAVGNFQYDDDVTNVALLLHDIGKPQCYTEDERGGHFYGHEEVSTAMSEEIVKRLKFDKKSQNEIVELVRYHDTKIEATYKTVRKWINKLGQKQFFRLMNVKLADMQAHADGTQDEHIARRDAAVLIANDVIERELCFQIKDLAIDGNDVISIGISQGRRVGEILDQCLDAVDGDLVENNKQALLAYVEELERNKRDAGLHKN